ncbi:MAG: DUF4124 domain-containing protein [Nitrospinaceae bacterium]|nr:DUF4124 domain-containing protein [Nitrospinaceae bacterium]NIR54091.1 DUF4124 domain-containing protein [Nitrospinaceae bacterium]NIS84509.1 DUF4124 domain-containing protein [Nitrospinaceae bacterium]NIT81304.1 DUF4124 domain-containing protein [Nitrospinaceae bacterium]NIU43591.1 DUF4124 domain-containing protein [Nitrospinaceae bacterium]
MRVLFVLLLLLAFTQPAFAKIYKWVDDQGKMHFTNNPSDIPPDKRSTKKLKIMKSGPSNPAPKLDTTPPPAPAPSASAPPAHPPRSTGVNKREAERLQRLIQKH